MLVKTTKKFCYTNGTIHCGKQYDIDIFSKEVSTTRGDPEIFIRDPETKEGHWFCTKYLKWDGCSSLEDTIEANRILEQELSRKMLFIDKSVSEYKECLYFSSREPVCLPFNLEIKDRAIRNVLYELVFTGAQDSDCDVFYAKKTNLSGKKTLVLFRYDRSSSEFYVFYRPKNLWELVEKFREVRSDVIQI